MMETVIVKNRSDNIHRDRFNGIDYTFLPNEEIVIPTEAARLFFGYNVEDKSRALSRAGRIGHNGMMKEGLSWLRAFEVKKHGEDSLVANPLVRQVYVTNIGKEEHKDTFNGRVFVFKPGQKALIPFEAAMLFFGYTERDKSKCLNRLGWLGSRIKNSSDKAEGSPMVTAMARLDKFKIAEAERAGDDNSSRVHNSSPQTA